MLSEAGRKYGVRANLKTAGSSVDLSMRRLIEANIFTFWKAVTHQLLPGLNPIDHVPSVSCLDSVRARWVFAAQQSLDGRRVFDQAANSVFPCEIRAADGKTVRSGTAFSSLHCC
jgi:hypothetical protein